MKMAHEQNGELGHVVMWASVKYTWCRPTAAPQADAESGSLSTHGVIVYEE